MDEKPDNSSPSNTADRNGNDTTCPGESFVPTPGEGSGGDWTFVTQDHYDPDESRDLTTVIISAIAEAEGKPIADIKSPPLYEVVDVESIDDALFGRSDVDGGDTESTIEFRYNQYKVGVEADGWVSVFECSTDSADNWA